MPGKKPILFLVGIAYKDPAQETEFNRWYEEIHIPEVRRAIPGMTKVTRYKATDREGPQFLAIYELRDEKVLQDFLSLRERQQRGEIHAFTPGPPYDVVLRKAFRPIS
ncbi:MAG: hypothetical protein HY676_02920 [Chloroflexi bacterium]|nr:hypothetical protein [Chloroflexota bacterium]